MPQPRKHQSTVAPSKPPPPAASNGNFGADKREKVLHEWHREAHVLEVAFERAAHRADVRARGMGATIALLSAVVGTSIFATLQERPEAGWKIMVGVLSVAAAILGSLQASLNYSGLAGQFRSAAEGYGKLRREIVARSLFEPAGAMSAKELNALRRAFDAAESGAPALPDRLYDKAHKDVEEEERDHPPL